MKITDLLKLATPTSIVHRILTTLLLMLVSGLFMQTGNLKKQIRDERKQFAEYLDKQNKMVLTISKSHVEAMVKLGSIQKYLIQNDISKIKASRRSELVTDLTNTMNNLAEPDSLAIKQDTIPVKRTLWQQLFGRKTKP